MPPSQLSPAHLSSKNTITFQARYLLLAQRCEEREYVGVSENESGQARRALIAGCGHIGIRVVEMLDSQGCETSGIVHSTETAVERTRALGIPVVAGDIADAGSLAEICQQPPHAVIHCASSGRGGGESRYRHVYRDGCRSLADAFPDALLLFTSSTSVYPQTDGSDVNEDSPAEPDRETGQILREAEKIVLAHRGIVTRLAGIFGPNRSVILKKLLDGTAAIEEDGRRYLHQIHRDGAAVSTEQPQLKRTDVAISIRSTETMRLPPSCIS